MDYSFHNMEKKIQNHKVIIFFWEKVESIRDSVGNFYTYKILSFDKFIKSVS